MKIVFYTWTNGAMRLVQINEHGSDAAAHIAACVGSRVVLRPKYAEAHTTWTVEDRLFHPATETLYVELTPNLTAEATREKLAAFAAMRSTS